MGYVDYDKFLMFGDSITELAFDQLPGPSNDVQFCLGAALQNDYARRLQILHRGFSGYTSREGIPLIKSILKHEHDLLPESQKIKIAYVFFGTNDSRHKGKSSENNVHIPIDKYLSNMKEIVQEFKDRNIPVIIVTPGLHDQKQWDKTHPQDLITGDFRDNKTNKRYQDILKQNINDIPILCLYDEMLTWVEKYGSIKAKNGDYSEILSDGIHFSGIGYKIFYDGIMKLIDNHYKHLSPQYISYKFPYYAELKEDTFSSID